jgi:hypothetical protein
MSIRFVYVPRYIGVALNATKQALSLTRLAAVMRQHYSVSATRRELDLVRRNAVTGDTSDSLYADAYASYTTRVVDPATASDAVGGTTRTVTVNGVSGSYQCYKTLQYGCNDFLTAGGRRLIVKAATYNFTSDLTLPSATGKTDSNRVVLMGDPAETAWAVINFGAGERQYMPTFNANANYTTTRKLEFTNSSGDVAGLVHFSGHNTYTGAIVEFCHIHLLRRPDNNNGVGVAMYGDDTLNTGVIIRNNHIHDIYGSGITQNAAGIQSFHIPGVTVYNNHIYDVPVAIYMKGQPTLHPGGAWDIGYNKFSDTNQNAVFMAIQGAGQPGRYEGDRIHHNLFYGGTYGVYCAVNETGSANSDLEVDHNTFAEDCVGLIAVNGMALLQVHSNAVAGSTERTYLEGPSNHPNSISESDYNAYYTVQGNVWGTGRYTGGHTVYSSLTAWRAAYPADNELLADMDENSITFITLGAVFQNPAADDYTPIGALIGAGKDGTDIGHDPDNLGPGWDP